MEELHEAAAVGNATTTARKTIGCQLTHHILVDSPTFS